MFIHRNEIEKKWEELTSKNNRIYNQSKFRLENFNFDETLNKVHLEVGLTDYKGNICLLHFCNGGSVIQNFLPILEHIIKFNIVLISYESC